MSSGSLDRLLSKQPAGCRVHCTVTNDSYLLHVGD